MHEEIYSFFNDSCSPKRISDECADKKIPGMTLKQKYGNTALVAGASEGIGAAYATCLAAEGFDLVLIARRLQPLKHLADLLESRYKINVMCISCDLSEINAVQQIEEALNGREINMLIYNAALSYIGPFIKNSAENHSQAAR